LALDTTTLRNRWIILTVSVLYKKHAILGQPRSEKKCWAVS